MRAQARNHIGVVFFALAAPGFKDRRRQPHLARLGQSGGFSHIRDHDRDLSALQPSRANRFGNRQEIRSPAGEKNSQAGYRSPTRHGLAHVYCTRRSPFTTRPIT